MDNIECSPQELFSQGLKNCGFSIIDSNCHEGQSNGFFCGKNSLVESDSNSSTHKYSLRKNNLRSGIKQSSAQSQDQREAKTRIHQKQSRPQMLNTVHSNHKYESSIFRKQESERIYYKFLSPENRFSCPVKISNQQKTHTFHQGYNEPHSRITEKETNFSQMTSQYSKTYASNSMGESKVISVFSQRPHPIINKESPYYCKNMALKHFENPQTQKLQSISSYVSKITIPLDHKSQEFVTKTNNKKMRDSMIDQLSSL